MERHHHPIASTGVDAIGSNCTTNDPLSDVIGAIVGSDPAASLIFNSVQNLNQIIQPQPTTFQSNPPATMPSSPHEHPVTAKIKWRDLVKVEIVEQPASTDLRFRYSCEGRLAGSIPGEKSTPQQKSYPTIRLVGDYGDRRAFVVVSCVTANQPYGPHPHNLVGKDCCYNGIYKTEIHNKSISFANLGIQCVRKKDIQDSLKMRQKMNIDPFNTKFKTQNHNLNAVRLCFQVFLENTDDPKRPINLALKPVVSNEIHDKKANTDLVICRISHASGSVLGGLEIILLCEKISRDDTEVRFFEKRNDVIVWEALGEFQQSNVHKQFAICFRTPAYHNIQVEQCVKCFIQLRRKSSGAESAPVEFEYYPLNLDPNQRKRPRCVPEASDHRTFDPRILMHRMNPPSAPAYPACQLSNFTQTHWRTHYDAARDSPSPNQRPNCPMTAPNPFSGIASGSQNQYKLISSVFPDFQQQFPSLISDNTNSMTPEQKPQFLPNIPTFPDFNQQFRPLHSQYSDPMSPEHQQYVPQPHYVDPTPVMVVGEHMQTVESLTISDLLNNCDEMEGASGELSDIMKELDKSTAAVTLNPAARF